MNASLSTCTHLAIAEVRFQTIANLPDAIHALQLHLHHAQYTQAVVLKNQTLQVEQFGQQQMLVPGIAKTFAFTHADRMRQFILNEQCLVLRTTEFTDIDSFTAFFQEGIYILHKLLNIRQANRVGMRLLKRIIPSRGRPLRVYLQAGEAKRMDQFGGLNGHSQTEIAHQFNDIHLVHRVKVHSHSGMELPNDISHVDLAMRSDLATYQGPSVFIDSDAYAQQPMDLQLPTVKKQLQQMHAILGLAYQSSVSDLALAETGFR